MNYEDACQANVSATEAKREIEKHNLEWADFIAEAGRKSTYTGKEVLDWLGY